MNILIFSAGNPGSVKKAPDKRERWLKTPGAFSTVQFYGEKTV